MGLNQNRFSRISSFSVRHLRRPTGPHEKWQNLFVSLRAKSATSASSLSIGSVCCERLCRTTAQNGMRGQIERNLSPCKYVRDVDVLTVHALEIV
jgi:hypothetical protein